MPFRTRFPLPSLLPASGPARWARVAATLGLRWDRKAEVMRGAVDSHAVTVRPSANPLSNGVQIEVDGAPPELTVRPRSTTDDVAERMGLVDSPVFTGDLELDVVAVLTGPPRESLARLDAGVRRTLIRGLTEHGLSVKGGVVTRAGSPIHAAPEALWQDVLDAVAIARSLGNTTGDVEDRLARLALRDPNIEVQQRALEALLERRTDVARETARAFLDNDDDPECALIAATFLRHAPTLERMAKDGRVPPELRANALEQLDGLAPGGVVVRAARYNLLKLEGDVEEGDVAAAARALVVLHTRGHRRSGATAVDLVCTRLGPSTNALVRPAWVALAIAVARAVVDLAPDDAELTLLTLLASADASVKAARVAILEGLAGIGGTRAVGPIQRHAADRDPAVRSAARAAVDAIVARTGDVPVGGLVVVEATPAGGLVVVEPDGPEPSPGGEVGGSGG